MPPFRVTYQPTRWGLLRIAGWTCLFLMLFVFLLPAPNPTKTDPYSLGRPDTFPMKLEEGDLKWVRDTPVIPANQVKIAWVADSSAKEVDTDPLTGSKVVRALPVQVLENLNRNSGYRPDLLFYYMKGRREAETYALLLEAISRKPDMIVVTLNPFWVYNSYAIAQTDTRFGTSLNNRGFSLDHLVFSALLAYPRETAFSIAGKYFGLFRNNLGYHRLFVQDAPTPSHRRSQDVKEEQMKQYFDYPLDFWLDSGGNWHGDRVLKLMKLENPETANWNRYFLKLSLERLAESGIPTYIYLAPLNPVLMQDQAARESYQAVMAALQRHFANLPPNVRFDLQLPQDINTSIRFGDLYHMADSGALPNYLATQIQRTLGDMNEKLPH